MKETGLMFKAPLVRAILEGHKTQTRRVVKGVKHFPDWGSAVGMVGGAWLYGSPAALGLAERGDRWSVTLDDDHIKRMCTREAYGWGAGAGCPMGLPGDRIYVRETWNWFDPQEIPADRVGQRAPFTGCQGKREIPWAAAYAADGPLPYPGYDGKDHWQPSIHMPKWAARIWLEITSVRVERLQSISRADAIAEGIQFFNDDHECGAKNYMDKTDMDYSLCPTDSFETLWKSTGGDWEANPWVWVIDFKTISTTGRPA